MTAEAAQKIGRYEIIRSVGKGAQGAVYLGRDPTLDRLVAVKVLTSKDAQLVATAGRLHDQRLFQIQAAHRAILS